MDDVLCFIRDTQEVFYVNQSWVHPLCVRRARWTGKSYVPDGCCNSIYILEDVDTGKEFEEFAENSIIRNRKDEER